MTTPVDQVVSPQNAMCGIADFTAVTACTTRAPTATANLAAANIIAMCGSSAAPLGSDLPLVKITVKGASSSFVAPTVAQLLLLWLWNPTLGKAYLIKEIPLTVVTPSTTSGAFELELPVDITVPSGCALYASTSITTTAATTAFVAFANGVAMGTLT